MDEFVELSERHLKFMQHPIVVMFDKSLKHTTKMVFNFLNGLDYNASGLVFPSQDTISEVLSMDKKTVVGAIAELEDRGLLKVSKPNSKQGIKNFNRNLYKLVDLREVYGDQIFLRWDELKKNRTYRFL